MENKTIEDSLRRQLREYQKRERHDETARMIFSFAIGGGIVGIFLDNDVAGALVGALLGWLAARHKQKHTSDDDE